MDKNILPECFIDTLLIEALVPTSKGYNHKKGCPAGAKAMQEEFNDTFALGIWDRDKRTIPYLKEFELINKKHDVELFKHPNKHHYLILHPVIEKWLYAQAQQSKLSPEDFRLPKEWKNFKKIAKKTTGNNKHIDDIKQFAKALRKTNAPGIQVLTDWTQYLKTYHRNADKNTLKQL